VQESKPKKAELLRSLQLAHLYIDCIEGEKESEEKKCTKAMKRAAEWKVTTEKACIEKRHAINKLKQSEESLSMVEMELIIEREKTPDAIAEATATIKVYWFYSAV